MSNEERTAPEEKYNRYSLVVAAAKCARIITDEYVLEVVARHAIVRRS